MLKDYIDNRNEAGQCTNNISAKTLEAFFTVARFVRAIKLVFGDTDRRYRAKMALEDIKQRGSAARYTAEF